MSFLTSRLTLVLVFIFVLVTIAANSWYRWDIFVVSPTAHLITAETDWYSEKTVRREDVTSKSKDEFEKSLFRQGFRLASLDNLDVGYQVKVDGLYWYLFKVSEFDKIYTKEYSIASGLCSQKVGILISDGAEEVRLLNPGGTCV